MLKTKQAKTIIKFFGALCLLLTMLFIAVPNIRHGFLDSLSAIYGSVLINLANNDRKNLDLDELTVSPLLERAAQMKADHMAANSYFAHNTPDGRTPWYWMELAGYKYAYAGENLAVNFLDSENVQTAWKNSPTHWLNIINPKYTEIGIATSTGIYKGHQAVFVVQMFGTPQ